MSAYVKISLEDDSRDHTVWVSRYDVRDAREAIDHAGMAAAWFIANLARDEESHDSVSRWLAGENILGTRP